MRDMMVRFREKHTCIWCRCVDVVHFCNDKWLDLSCSHCATTCQFWHEHSTSDQPPIPSTSPATFSDFSRTLKITVFKKFKTKFNLANHHRSTYNCFDLAIQCVVRVPFSFALVRCRPHTLCPL